MAVVAWKKSNKKKQQQTNKTKPTIMLDKHLDLDDTNFWTYYVKSIELIESKQVYRWTSQ